MDYSRYSDIELITLLKEDSPSANDVFNIIFLKYMSQLFGYCIYQCKSRDEAEELMQETWIKFYNSIKSGKTTNNILALLFSIARNISLNNHKYSQRRANIHYEHLDNIDYDMIGDPFNFQDTLEKEELFHILEIAVNNLDDKFKETILLYWFGEMSFKEIAAICEETEDCIRRRFERATKQLFKMLEPYLA
jgi:RNA polymerase sigma factor (sigma-70 family)